MVNSNGWYRLEANKKSGGQGAEKPMSAPGIPRPKQREPQGGSTLKNELERASRPQAPPRQQTSGRPPQAPQRPAPKPPQPTGAGVKTIHSQTVGQRGPVVAQDQVLHETLEDFVHSTSLARVVHSKGFGAFGYFQTTNSMRDYTRASIFQNPGQQTQVATRFSLAVSNPGTPDTGRNVRGFSTKFYTGEGVFDLLTNHIPVFLVRDSIRFPDSIRAFLPSPVNNLADPNRFWGFVATAPEATNFVTWLYSDVGTVKSLRKIRASSVNTYVWQNAQGVRRYVKYHWLPVAGEETIDRQEAGKLAGENPDIAGQDLFSTIAAGTAVEFELHVQLMTPQEGAELPYDPLDDTKIWDEVQFPLHQVGRLVLNRNPDNYKEQIEKLAFSPSNLLDGIEFSDDKMLQGRSFIYTDAQRHRLGNDFHKIPVNKQDAWKPDSMVTSGDGERVEGTLTRSDIPKQNDFTQAGQRYNSLTPQQQDHLVDNIASDLVAVSVEIQRTVMSYLYNASSEMANRITEQMKVYAK